MNISSKNTYIIGVLVTLLPTGPPDVVTAPEFTPSGILPLSLELKIV